MDIEAEALTTFEVTPDGARIRLNARDSGGGDVSFSLPVDCVSQMVMTLPRIAQEAVRRLHGDDSLKIVYPAGTWNLERSAHDPETYIVSLGTPDGFAVSFALSPAKMSELSRSICDVLERLPHEATRLN
jgi:hypothetical protein